MRDPYEALGLPRGADPVAIKRAYRRLILRFHPDRNPGRAWAQERFLEVAAAYAVLGDDRRRALYHRFGEASLRPGFVPPATSEPAPPKPAPPKAPPEDEPLPEFKPDWRELVTALLGG